MVRDIVAGDADHTWHLRCEPERAGKRRMRLSGIELRDWPTVIRMRLTVCRRHGHYFGLDEDYCENCGGPWFFISARKWRRV